MVYDIILLAIVILFVIIGVRKGAAASLAGMLTAFVSYTAATFFGKLIAVNVYQLFLRQTIHDTVTNGVSAFGTETLNDSLNSMDFSSIDFFGVQDGLKSWVGDQMTEPIADISNSAGQTAETVMEPIVVSILSFFITIILFFIIWILLRKLVMPLVLKVFKIPVIKQVNALLGGVIGLVEAVLLACMLAYLLRLIIPQISTDFWLLKEETIYSSFIFKHLYDGNIFSMFASWLTV